MHVIYAIEESDGYNTWVKGYYLTRELATKHLPSDTYFESFEVVEYPVIGE